MPTKALRFIRKMRGGAQAHLLEADDGKCYVVKFSNNPQHRRVLVNEWIGAKILRALGIATPATAIIDVSPEFLQANPQVHFGVGNRISAVQAGQHFGSQYPGHPSCTAVYDFLPDSLLRRAVNISDFLGVYVFDRWLANVDARQCIFYRSRPGQPSGEAVNSSTFIAQMVDHGFLFGGEKWSFNIAPLHGLYFRWLVYCHVRTTDDFQPWLDRIMKLPESVLREAYQEIPLAWIDGDRERLADLLERAYTRRARVYDLIETARGLAPTPFPNWT